MPTIEELTDENAGLRELLMKLQAENVKLKEIELAVRGIVHHVETHSSTPEELREAVVTFKAVSALSEVIA